MNIDLIIAASRMIAIIGAVIMLLIMAYMVFIKEKTKLAKALAMELIANAGYRLVTGLLFLWTTATGSFYVLNIEAGRIYAIVDMILIIPLFILFVILVKIFRRGSYENHLEGLVLATDYVRTIQKHKAFEQMPDDIKEGFESLEDVFGNLKSNMQGVKELYERYEELK